MAYVIAKPPRAGRPTRYEIRESVVTDRGPRARSLATFAVLDDVVLAKARARALRPFVDATVVTAAWRVGAPVTAEPAAERQARALLAEVRAGRRPPPAISALLCDALATDASLIDDNHEAAAQWIGVTEAQRGETLAQLLELADVLPQRRRPPDMAFPRIDSR